jgi:hypothetical protein
MGAAPGSTAAGLAAMLDSAGMLDVRTLQALPGLLPSGLSESATQLLIDSGLGAAPDAIVGGGSAAADAPPLHAARLRELQGVMFPTASKQLLAFGSEAFVAAPAAAALLPGAAGRIAHPRCVVAHGLYFNHPAFQTALALKPLTLPRLASLLHTALPSRCVQARGVRCLPRSLCLTQLLTRLFSLSAPQPGAAAVAWDGAAPAAEWVRGFWAHVAAAAPEEAALGRRSAQMDAFSAFALLPTLSGELVRVSHREMVFVPPPGAALSADATADATAGDAAAPSARGAASAAGSMAAMLAAMATAVLQPGAAAGGASMRALWPALQPLLLRLGAPVLDARYAGAAAMCAATNSPPDGYVFARARSLLTLL